jgi:hypothetical protein
MNFQHRSEARVVDLNATHFVGLLQLQPYQLDSFCFRQQCHLADHSVETPRGLFDRNAKPVAIDGSGADIPKLAEILSCEAPLRILGSEMEHTV